MANSRILAFALAGIAGAGPVSAMSVLGTSADFAVLGGAAVTNAGLTTIEGDLGSYPGTAITGTSSITIAGTIHPGDAIADQAHDDAAAAFTLLAGLSGAVDLSGQDLGTVGVLAPGVYKFATTAQLTGALVLDFASNPGGMYVFQIGTSFGTASGSSITVLNGGVNSGLYFTVGSSATLGAGSHLAGNIIAGQSITFNSGASLTCGRAIAIDAAITLDSNMVSNDCGAGDFYSRGYSASGVPEPTNWAMMTGGFALAGTAMRTRKQAYRRTG